MWPPFLAQFPYAVAFIGWVSASILPYLAVMRAIVGRAFGLVLAIGFPVVMSNALVGQNGFLTAALIGGTLYLLPTRPILSGICLGLLTYKPQYGFLFPIVLIAASEWKVFFSASATAVALALVSCFAFGIESWKAFFHWMPVFSQAFLVEGKATWWKLQSLYSLVRYLGGSEQLGWIFQWVLTAAVATTLVAMWRSNLRYSLKAAALAVGTLLTTPYLFMYDVMVLAIPIAYLVRLGLASGFRSLRIAGTRLRSRADRDLHLLWNSGGVRRNPDRRGAGPRAALVPGGAELQYQPRLWRSQMSDSGGARNRQNQPLASAV